MSKNILIAGKDLLSVSELAEGFNLSGNKVCVADDSSQKTSVPVGVSSIVWNKASAVAARSLIIQSETLIGYADEYILYFDSPSYSASFSSFSAESCARASDEMIVSFQYLTIEILNRIEQKKQPAKIIFILRSHPSIKDFAQSPVLKSSGINPANPFVASAEAAFATFAENIAAFTAEKENTMVLLVSGDAQNEVMQKGSSLSQWLGEYTESLDNSKGKPTGRASLNWVKAGAKTGGVFSLFR